MALKKKKKNYNEILYELQKEAVLNKTGATDEQLKKQAAKQDFAQEKRYAPITKKSSSSKTSTTKNETYNPPKRIKNGFYIQDPWNGKNYDPGFLLPDPWNGKNYDPGFSRVPTDRTTTTKEKDDKRTWFEGGAFSDGYDFGDVFKTILATTTDLYQDAAQGAIGIGEKAIDAGAYLVGGAAKLFGADDFAEDTKSFIKKDLIDEEKISNRITNTGSVLGWTNNIINGDFDNFNPFNTDGTVIEENSLFGDKADSLVQSGGQLVATAGLQAVGVPWWLTTGVTSFGAETEQAFNSGATYGEAGVSGLFTAGAEILTEKLSGGIKFGGKTLDDVWLKPLTEKISNKIVKNAINIGIDAVGEGTEEVLSEVISNVGKKLSYEDEKTWGELLTSEQAMDNYLEAFIGGSVLGGGGSVAQQIQSNKNVTETETQKNINKQIQDLESQLDTSMNPNQQQEVLSQINTLKEQYDTETQNIAKQKQEQENAERELRRTNFTYDTTKITDEVEKSVYDSATKYFNNTARSHEFVERVAKISKDKGTRYSFINNEELQSNGLNVEGKQVNGLVRTEQDGKPTILINIDSNKALNTIVGHETTHLLEGTQEYQELQQSIFEYAKTKGDLDTVRNNLTELYKDIENADIDSELTAELVGDYLFTDSKFIDSLAVEKPTLFQKIKELIDDLVIRFTGTKEERQLRQVQKAFKNAYSVSNSNNVDTKYSINQKKTLYTGSSNTNIQQFKVGGVDGSKQTGDRYGKGVYLTTNKDTAKVYAGDKGKVYETNVDDLNIFDLNDTITKEMQESLINELNVTDNQYRNSILRNIKSEKKFNDFESAEKFLDTQETIWKEQDGYYDANKPKIKSVDYKTNKATIEYTDFNNLENAISNLTGNQLYDALKSISTDDFSSFITGNGYDGISFNEDADNQQYVIYKNEDKLKINNNTKQSIKDNQGRTLTKEQQEYFKDSKARDDNGNLEVVYHGSLNAGFFNFNKNFNYFTSSKDIATTYTPSSEMVDTNIKSEKKAYARGGIYEGYVNITNPLIIDVHGEKWSGIPLEYVEIDNIKEVFDNNGSSYFKEDGKIRTSTNDIVDAIFNNEEVDFDYDGIIFKNIEDRGMYFHGKMSDHSSSVYVTKNSNQFKAVDNTNPTSDADIRYSLSEDNSKVQRAKEYFGVTTDLREAGYLTIDGEYIDLSGKNQGGTPGTRTLDHRDIGDIYTDEEYDLAENKYSSMGTSTALMQAFIDEGNIRLIPGQGVDISVEPTKAQYDKLYNYLSYIQTINGDVLIDLETETKNRENLEYNDRTSVSKMINDIKNHYAKTTTDVKYSLSEETDNQGRKLTEYTIEKTKNSKVRDENGKLMLMYHGSPDGTYNQLRAGTYFTSNKEYADGYQWEGASSISYGKQVNNPRTYEAYLNITNPFTLKDETAKNIYLNEYIKGGNSAYFDPYTDYTDTINNMDEIDWVEGVDLQEWLQENHPEYDGMYLDEGGAGGYGGAEYQWRGYSVIPFSEEQIIKANNNNTEYSLSQQGQDIAPTGDYNVYGKDVKLQVEEAIAPLQEKIETLTERLDTVVNSTEQQDIAPVQEVSTQPTKAELDNLMTLQETGGTEYANEFFRLRDKYGQPKLYKGINEYKKSPNNYGMIEEGNLLTEADLDEFYNQSSEVFKTITDEDAPMPMEDTTPDYDYEKPNVESPLYDRDIEEVGNRKVKAYQYEHPEVRPYFQEAALGMMYDLDNTTKGERIYNDEVYYNTNGEEGWMGIKRNTTDDIADLLDNFNYSYADIRKGLEAIIKDNGAENIAVAKRIEFALDDRLRNGYTAVDGLKMPPNQEYIDLLRGKEIADYYNSIPVEDIAPIETNLEETSAIAPETKNVAEKVLKTSHEEIVSKPETTKETTKEVKKSTNPIKPKTKGSTIDTLNYLFINRNEAIDRFAKETGNNNIKFLADHVNNVSGEISTNINKAQIDNEGRVIGKSIVDIFNQARETKLTAAFEDYLFHLSNKARHKQGKGSLVPLTESKALIIEYEKAYPEMKKWAREVNKYNKNNLYKQVEAGLYSKEFADGLVEKYEFYVPFFADVLKTYVPSDTKTIKTRGTVRLAEGGANRNLLSFEEAMIRQTQMAVTSIRKNQLYQEIVDSSPQASIGSDLDANGLYVDENGYYLTAKYDGENVSAYISEDLYKGLENRLGQDIRNIEQKLSGITKPLQAIGNIRRNILTTWSPSFIITNPAKDIQDAPLNSKYAKDWAINYPKAMAELTTGKGEHLQEFLNMYGEAGIMGDYVIDSGVRDATKIAKTKKKLAGITRLNEMLELAPRYAEYLASIKNGVSQMEALYNAREVTTNFGRGGVITKALNRNGFTFLNASVQGFNKLYRNFSGENGAKGVVNASLKAVMFGVVPALFNALSYDDDEDYEALPDYIKDNYYLYKTDDGEFIRIPKGRMISIFGSAARRALEAAQGEENAFEGYLTNAYSQVGIQNPMESNIFAPLLQAYGSKNGKTWYGTDLVPTRLQDVPVEEQYDESTDKFSIWLGQTFGISPYKVNYVFDQYSGGIGDLLLPTITEEANSDGSFLAPLKDKFVVNSTMDNKYASEFYTKRDKLQVNANSMYATEEDKLMSMYMDEMSWDMSALYKEKREVQNDTSLTKKEKYERVQEIQQQINDLAKEAINTYDTGTYTDNYVSIGDYEFYKGTDYNGNEEWKTVYDYKVEELAELGMTPEEKNEYFGLKQEFDALNNEYYDTKDNLESTYGKHSDEFEDESDELYMEKKNTIIDTIMASNLTDDAKAYLYKEYYSSSAIDTITMSGIPVDYILDYQKNNFKADYNSDGKAIPNSRKNKVIDYVNEFDLSVPEKAIIIKSTNTFKFNDYNDEIVSYVADLDIPDEDKRYILEELDMTIDEEGYVWWKD